jgi:hypothetical protein
MPTKKPSPNGRRRKAQQPLPERFVSQSLSQVDRRFAVVRQLKAQLKELIEYTGADTPQKCSLCEQAVWMQHRLAQMRAKAIETGEADDGIMTQMSNALSGIWTKLGINKVKVQEMKLAELLQDEEEDQ